MKLKFNETYSHQAKKGMTVTVDKIRYKVNARNHFVVRVVGLWKKPQWFDLGWFIKTP